MSIARAVFFSYNSVDTALELYRFHSPLKAAGIELVQGVVNGEVKPELIEGADLVCFQRDFSRCFKTFQSILTEARARQIPVLMDLDDDLLSLPPDHPDRLAGDFADSLPALLHAVLSADALSVATPELKQKYEALNPHVIVLPNYLDTEIWQFRQPVLRMKAAPVNILFMGTPTHIPDLNGIAEALRGTAMRFGANLRFVFFGAKPPEGLEDIARVEYYPAQSYDYHLFQQQFCQLEADIAIAPLRDNPFNRCKSAIKFLEYSARGLPGVYAALPPYTRAVQDGENGFLAGDTQEWERKLGALIEDPQLCLRMAEQAQQDVRRGWLIQNHGQEWWKAYDEIARRGPTSAGSRTPMAEKLAAVAMQMDELRELTHSRYSKLHEDLAAQHTEILILQHGERIEALKSEILTREVQIDALRDEITQKKGRIEDLLNETVRYANSRSWKLTRPLRVFNRLLARLLKR